MSKITVSHLIVGGKLKNPLIPIHGRFFLANLAIDMTKVQTYPDFQKVVSPPPKDLLFDSFRLQNHKDLHDNISPTAISCPQTLYKKSADFWFHCFPQFKSSTASSAFPSPSGIPFGFLVQHTHLDHKSQATVVYVSISRRSMLTI